MYLRRHLRHQSLLRGFIVGDGRGMGQPTLYPAQLEGVKLFLQSEGRFLFTYGTGVGKTPTAITAMLRYLRDIAGTADPRILVVCPAIVRRHWCTEFWRWAWVDARPIEMGKTRKTGTKAALRARDEAFASRVQVVSYDLLPQVEAEGWDGIIFDEIHHLSDYGSLQSKMARSLLQANPMVPALGLSATLIPTKVHQLWHPLHLLWPGKWGRAPRTGSIPWQFVAQWQHIEDEGYGKRPGAARVERLEELRARLSEVAHRLTREDIAADLPPVDARPLELPGMALGRELRVAGRPRPETTAALQWVEALPADIHHSVILCYHRDVAAEITRALTNLNLPGMSVMPISGQMTTAQRVQTLALADATAKAIVVATSESIREGIRLMWAQRVLYAEWRQSPKQVIQTLGRFTSVGDSRRPQIDVLTDESLRDKAQVLMRRIEDINGIMSAGSTESKVAEVFAQEDLSPEQLEAATKAMFAQRALALDSEWTEVTDGEDDDGW